MKINILDDELDRIRIYNLSLNDMSLEFFCNPK